MRGPGRMCKLEKKLKGLGFPGGTSAPAAQQVPIPPVPVLGRLCPPHQPLRKGARLQPRPGGSSTGLPPGRTLALGPQDWIPASRTFLCPAPGVPQTQAQEPPPWPISQGQTPLQSPRGKGAP